MPDYPSEEVRVDYPERDDLFDGPDMEYDYEGDIDGEAERAREQLNDWRSFMANGGE